MFQRLVFTIATAAGLIGLCVVYRLTMRQIVEIPQQTRPPVQTAGKTDFEPPNENRRVAEKYLPEWAAKSDLSLHTNQAFVYTKRWKRLENNKKQVEFTPFCMAWLTTDSEGQESAIAVSSDSAILEFELEMSDQFSNPGRVIKAMFNDDVRLTGPNGMEVVGQNFIFDESTLYLQTSYPVSFQYMSHRGLATKMKMKLLPSAAGPDGSGPRIYGVETVRLSGGVNPFEPKLYFVQLSTEVPRGKEKIPAMIRCSGDLNYHVLGHSVVLMEDVRAQIGVKPDTTTLESEKMTIQLEPKKPVATVDGAGATVTQRNVSPAGEKFQSFQSDLEVRWLVAEGVKPTDMVKIKSREYGFNAKMQSLRYHAFENRVLMLSNDPQRPPVHIDRHGSQLDVPIVNITYRDDNSLDTLICEGNGKLMFFDEKTKKITLAALWQQILTMRREGTSDLHFIELVQNAQFRRPGETNLKADRINVWLANVAMKMDGSTPASKTDPQATEPTPEPKRMRAEGNVSLASLQMMIDRTNELDVQFEESAPATKTTSVIAPISPHDQRPILATRPAESTPTRAKARTQPKVERETQVGFANVPPEADQSRTAQSRTSPSSKVATEKPQDRKNRPKPIRAVADRIYAILVRSTGSENPEPRDVRAEGHVEITRMGEFGEKELSLCGDTVHMQSTGGEEGTVNVLGSPATIHSPQMNLEGRDLNLDRITNRASVRGAGTMKVPIPQDANLGELQAAADRELRVRWRESMEFDGLTAVFAGQVESKLGRMIVRCEQMSVNLVRRMSFEGQQNPNQEKPELRLIHCQENVTFENSRFERNRLIDVYRGNVGELTVDHSTGKVDATGPGNIRVWQLKDKENDDHADYERPQANRPIPSEISTWNYTQIEFEGKLTGQVNLKSNSDQATRNIKVFDRVEVCHGPVESASAIVDQDKLPPLGGTMRCQQLEVVSYPPAKGEKKGYFHLTGSGNTEVEGRVNDEMYTASADRISYDEAKGMLTLLSRGKRISRIRGMVNQDARDLVFHPKTRELKITGATGTSASR